MKSFILFLYQSSILFSVITAFIYRKDLKKRKLLILLPYLLFVFIQELGIYFYLIQYPKATTGIIYNFYRPVTVIVFSILYYQIPFKFKEKKIISLLLTVYLVFTIIIFTLLQSVFALNKFLGAAGGLMITTYGIFFLFFYFMLDDKELENKWRPMIPITIGLIAFYPVINISTAFHKYLLHYHATIFGMPLYNLIPQLMSIFMYCCFARAFYLCRKIN